MTVWQTFATLLTGLGATLALTGGALSLGAVVALPIAGLRRSRFRSVRFIAIAYIEIARGIPPIAWLFLIFFGLTQFGIRMSNMVAAIIGLGLVSSAYLAEIYRSSMAALPDGQYEAAHALSFSRPATFLSVILPQAVVTGLPQFVNYGIGLLKDSAIASVIGVGGVVTVALMLSRRSLDALGIFILCGLVYMLISVPIAYLGRWISGRLERRLGMVR